MLRSPGALAQVPDPGVVLGSPLSYTPLPPPHQHTLRALPTECVQTLTTPLALAPAATPGQPVPSLAWILDSWLVSLLLPLLSMVHCKTVEGMIISKYTSDHVTPQLKILHKSSVLPMSLRVRSHLVEPGGTSCHSPTLLAVATLEACCFSHLSDTLLPQGLCTGSSLHLDHSVPAQGSRLAHSQTSFES